MGGELMGHIYNDIPDKLGDVLKEARQKSGFTVEEFARKVDILCVLSK